MAPSLPSLSYSLPPPPAPANHPTSPHTPFTPPSFPQDNVVMRGALVCENAVIRANAVVEPGAIVSFNVVIGQGHRVAGNKRISLCQQIHGAVGIRVVVGGGEARGKQDTR